LEPRPSVRYRFGPYVLSPRQRSLTRDDRDVALIPRYFDLLVLLVRRRQDAVHRAEIFSTVWADVIVSDGALTQAIRSLRRTLGDDPRDPTFIRTLSRHGYRFVHANVVEEPDTEEAAMPAAAATSHAFSGLAESPVPQAPGDGGGADLLDRLVARLQSADVTEDERRDAAEQLHTLGATRVLARLGAGPGSARARAMLRDARWDVPGADAVPLFGEPGGWRAAAALVGVRARRAWRLAGGRWLSAAAGAAAAGLVTGTFGGLVLWQLPGASAPATAPAVLGVLGACAGAVGGAGVGAGLASAEALARSFRGTALVVCGALGGLAVGTIALGLALWTLEGLFGVDVGPVGGPVQGALLGAACGAGFAWATREVREGMAAPRGRVRLAVAGRVALCCAATALALAATGRPMVGGLVNEIARASRTSSLALTPIARAIGEPEFGRVTAGLVGAVEGAAFGLGLILGLTRRHRTRD
jgi:DNA-binding winged helix-turn-helix (wHTH) protein